MSDSHHSAVPNSNNPGQIDSPASFRTPQSAFRNPQSPNHPFRGRQLTHPAIILSASNTKHATRNTNHETRTTTTLGRGGSTHDRWTRV